MKSFLKVVLLFTLPLILGGTIMELLLRHIPNRFQLQNKYLEENGEDIETLILGSSHSQFGINPEYLESPSYNLSNKSQTLDIDYALLRYYGGNRMPNLKNVVLRLSYATLFEKLDAGNESWRLKDYNIYFKTNFSNDFRHKFETLSVSPRENFRRIISYYVMGDDEVKSNELGWGNELVKNSKLSHLEKLGPVTAKKHTAKNVRFYSENKAILEKFVDRCSRMDIKVILVTMPASKYYVENLSKQQLKLTYQLGEKLDDQFLNCNYYNFLDHEGFINKHFYDADHLNANGAAKFSLIINQLLQQ